MTEDILQRAGYNPNSIRIGMYTVVCQHCQRPGHYMVGVYENSNMYACTFVPYYNYIGVKDNNRVSIYKSFYNSCPHCYTHTDIATALISEGLINK